jgi:hypothetical protein
VSGIVALAAAVFTLTFHDSAAAISPNSGINPVDVASSSTPTANLAKVRVM